MGIAHRGLHVAMPRPLLDHGQRSAATNGQRDVRVPQGVQRQPRRGDLRVMRALRRSPLSRTSLPALACGVDEAGAQDALLEQGIQVGTGRSYAIPIINTPLLQWQTCMK